MQVGNLNIVFTYCHKNSGRSFFWKGRQFPVCARCTGIYLGYLSYPFFVFDIFFLNFYLTLFLILPALIDGLSQAFYNRESNNLLRVVTGFFAGVGLMSLVSIIGERIGTGILYLIALI